MLEGRRTAGVGADLDEHGISRGIDGMEIHLVSPERAEVVDLTTAAEKLNEDSGFKSMAEVAPTESLADGNESRIHGVGLAGVDHALALGSGEERGGADEKGVLEISEERVQRILGHGQSLRLQAIIELLDAKRSARVS